MRRKFLCAVLSLLMLVTMLPVVTGADDSSGSPTITFEQQTTAAGASEVKVDVKITNNPGFVSATIPVKWDASVMTLKDITLSTDVVAIGWCGMSMTDYATSGTQGIYYLAWNNDTRTEADGGNFTSDGKLCTMEFTVKDTSKDTSCDITANLEAAIANMMNFAMNDLCDNGLTAVSTKVNLKAADAGTEDPDEDGVQFVINDISKVRAGDTISVPIEIKNNDGLAGIIIKAYYDATVLTYTDVTVGEIFENGLETSQNTDDTGSYIQIAWASKKNVSGDCTLLSINFTVSEEAKPGKYNFNILFEEKNIVKSDDSSGDGVNVPASVVCGTLEIVDYLPGDINDDGSVDIKDQIRLLKYLAGNKVEVNEKALDVNGDGSVDIKDQIRLLKYLAGIKVEIF